MIKEIEKVKLEKKLEHKEGEPKSYNVILLNDDYTTMDFVVMILIEIFNKVQSEAVEIMMRVHTNGSEIVGTYSFDIANTKVKKVTELAELNDFPLKAIMEEA